MRIFKFDESLTRKMATLNEQICTVMIIGRSKLLRVRKFSGEGFRENDNTHFMFNFFFPKIMPFMRQCRKIW
jgi:hypothetical protein